MADPHYFTLSSSGLNVTTDSDALLTRDEAIQSGKKTGTLLTDKSRFTWQSILNDNKPWPLLPEAVTVQGAITISYNTGALYNKLHDTWNLNRPAELPNFNEVVLVAAAPIEDSFYDKSVVGQLEIVKVFFDGNNPLPFFTNTGFKQALDSLIYNTGKSVTINIPAMVSDSRPVNFYLLLRRSLMASDNYGVKTSIQFSITSNFSSLITSIFSFDKIQIADGECGTWGSLTDDSCRGAVLPEQDICLDSCYLLTDDGELIITDPDTHDVILMLDQSSAMCLPRTNIPYEDTGAPCEPCPVGTSLLQPPIVVGDTIVDATLPLTYNNEKHNIVSLDKLVGSKTVKYIKCNNEIFVLPTAKQDSTYSYSTEFDSYVRVPISNRNKLARMHPMFRLEDYKIQSIKSKYNNDIQPELSGLYFTEGGHIDLAGYKGDPILLKKPDTNDKQYYRNKDGSITEYTNAVSIYDIRSTYDVTTDVSNIAADVRLLKKAPVKLTGIPTAFIEFIDNAPTNIENMFDDRRWGQNLQLKNIYDMYGNQHASLLRDGSSLGEELYTAKVTGLREYSKVGVVSASNGIFTVFKMSDKVFKGGMSLPYGDSTSNKIIKLSEAGTIAELVNNNEVNMAYFYDISLQDYDTIEEIASVRGLSSESVTAGAHKSNMVSIRVVNSGLNTLLSGISPDNAKHVRDDAINRIKTELKSILPVTTRIITVNFEGV